MKKRFRILTTIVILFFASAINQVYAQPHPNEQANGNTNGGAPIAGAPIGSGVAILITLAAAYGGRKVYDARKIKADQA